MLYQSGTQRIEVIVRKDSGAAVPGTNEAEGTDNTPGEKARTWRSAVFGSEDPKRIKRVIVTNATHTLATAKQLGNLYLDYWISGIGYNSGDQALQSRISRQVEQITDVSNVASNLARGAVFGAWGGPIGMVIGAALGAGTSVASIGFRQAGREREYNFTMMKEANSIEYNRARAGTIDSNGRLR